MVVWMPIYVVQIYKSKRPSSANRSAGDLAAELLLTKPWVASGQSAQQSHKTDDRQRQRQRQTKPRQTDKDKDKDR